MSVQQPKLLLTLDSMKYPNSGFYYFGKSLGNALIEQNKGRFDFTYYLHKRADYYFDGKVKTEFLSKLHKLYYPNRGEYDLVHFTDQYCRLKPQRVNAKRIITIHDLNPVHEKSKPAHKIQAHLNKLRGYISRCDKVVAISNFVAKDIINHIPEAEAKMNVIYNGADKIVAKPSHTPAYKPTRPFLFTIGFVAPKKNFHVLPPLLQHNDMQLIIAGIETSYKDRIIEEARKFGCQDRVIITGPVSDNDKAWYYKHCKAFVFPSIAEGFGLPVIEAMHFGKPVFLSAHTSLPEIGGEAATYFDSFDPGAMQQVFMRGMETHYKNNLAERNMAHAAQFDWRNTADQYLQLYADCLAGK